MQCKACLQVLRAPVADEASASGLPVRSTLPLLACCAPLPPMIAATCVPWPLQSSVTPSLKAEKPLALTRLVKLVAAAPAVPLVAVAFKLVALMLLAGAGGVGAGGVLAVGVLATLPLPLLPLLGGLVVPSARVLGPVPVVLLVLLVAPAVGGLFVVPLAAALLSPSSCLNCSCAARMPVSSTYTCTPVPATREHYWVSRMGKR